MKEKDFIFREKALEIYRLFKQRPGSEHIANPATLTVVIDILENCKPLRILELGGGIGTISYALLKHSDAHVDIYEQIDFCRDEMKKNLKEFEGRYALIDNYRMLPPYQKYDLMVIDGGGAKGMGKGFRTAVWHYIHYLNDIKVIYVDGHRYLQRIWARKALKSKYIYTLRSYNNISYEGRPVTGGLEMRCRRSQNPLARWINYIYWELVEWYPVKYFFQYRFDRLRRLLSPSSIKR